MIASLFSVLDIAKTSHVELLKTANFAALKHINQRRKDTNCTFASISPLRRKKKKLKANTFQPPRTLTTLWELLSLLLILEK